MAHVRKSTEELIAEEEKKSEQVKARMAELKARQRVEERKRDNHRKIVVGAAVMAHIKIDPRFRKDVQSALNQAVTDPKHRAVIPDLLDEKAFLAGHAGGGEESSRRGQGGETSGGGGQSRRAGEGRRVPGTAAIGLMLRWRQCAQPGPAAQRLFC